MSLVQSVVNEGLENGSCCLQLSGDLNISNAQAMHQAVHSVCETHSEIELVLHDVTSFDVAAMQILLSATQDEITKVVVRAGENADCVAHWLDIAGLSGSFEKQTV